jgi:purine nucleosidase
VVAIGPLTNIAVAMSLEPRFAATVKEIVIMGGIFLGQTNKSEMPGEFNVWVDPEAAYAVLHSGARLSWVGLDVTMQVRLTREDAAAMASGAGAFASFAGEYTTAWIDYLAAANPGEASHADSCAMHDPLAVAVVTQPGLVTWKDAHVDVITGDGTGRGVMIADLLTSARPPVANCRIAIDVDVDAFRTHFLSSIARL